MDEKGAICTEGHKVMTSAMNPHIYLVCYKVTHRNKTLSITNNDAAEDKMQGLTGWLLKCPRSLYDFIKLYRILYFCLKKDADLTNQKQIDKLFCVNP